MTKKLQPWVWRKIIREGIEYANRRRRWDGRWRKWPGGPSNYIMTRARRWPDPV